MNWGDYGVITNSERWLNAFYIPRGTAMATAAQARMIRARMMGWESKRQMNNR